MANGGVLSLQDVQALFTDINAELIEAPYSPELVAPKIAWVRKGATGLVTRFTIQMVSNAYQKRAPGEPTPFKKAEYANFQCEVSELDPDAYFISNLDLEGDVYGIIKPNLPQMLNRAMLCLDQELAAFIVGNPVTVYELKRPAPVKGRCTSATGQGPVRPYLD